MQLKWRHPLEAWVSAGLIILSLVLYWPALRVFFSLDDLRFLLRAAGLEEAPDGIRRVLSVRLYFKAAWVLFGTNPRLYHLMTILLHAMNAWLIYLIAARLKLDRIAGLCAAVLFLASTAAFLPLHWISGIQEVSMTFFALLAAYFYLGSDAASMVLALVTAALAVLCKEASVLVLPGMAVMVPAPRKRRIVLGAGGLVLAATFLIASGSLEPNPPGDPYESVFGINILWNLLTYSAWLAWIWDYFPDRIPQYQAGLAHWGLILPAALAIVAWRYPRGRKPIAKASLLFIILLIPVLGLVRHSYMYYLYLPLVPFWLLAGAALGSASQPRIAAAVVACYVIFSVVTGTFHRKAELKPGVLSDPMLRYAAIAKRGVAALAASDKVPEDNILFVRSFEGDAVDLSVGLEGRTGTESRKVHLFKVALLDGDALKLFFPGIEETHFEGPVVPISDWEEMHIFGTYGLAETIYLGYGREGRIRFVKDLMSAEMYERADRETDILLHRFDRDPQLWLLKGEIAHYRGDNGQMLNAIEQLEVLVENKESSVEAVKAINILKSL